MVNSQFQNSLSYFIGNRKLSELVIDVTDYRESDIGSDQFLTLDKLKILPKMVTFTQELCTQRKYTLL
jgi:hypothetical protein